MLSYAFGARLQVDEESVLRHKGERKVKTLEEEMDDVATSTADLLEEGEELVGTESIIMYPIYTQTHRIMLMATSLWIHTHTQKGFQCTCGQPAL